MKQEDFELIYNYLHEYFNYKDGDFYRKKEIHGSEIGRKMGCIKIHPAGNCYMVGAFSINGKQYNKRISHLVYLYHFKELPKYIRLIDGNKMNTCLENIIKTRLRQNTKPKKFMQGRKIRYRVEVIIEGYTVSLGSYHTEKYAYEALYVLQKYATDYSITPEEIERKTRFELGLGEKGKMTYKKERSLPEGVDISKNRFRARIRVTGERLNLGTFVTADEAHNAYLKAKERFRR